MNILNKIKKKWDFSKSVEQNAIHFNTKENAEKKARKKMLFLVLFVLALAMFFHNPLLGLAMMIGTISYGSEYVFNSAWSSNMRASKIDSTHFVVVYTDDSNSYYGTAIIGTVSGSTISYGDEYVFNSATTNDTGISLLDSTHFVVGYRLNDVDDYGYCKIGTISGSTISYGSAYQINSANTEVICLTTLDATHFVVGYQDKGGDTYGHCKVGTVSGSTISYGSEYVFNSATTTVFSISALDSTHFVVGYTDGGASYAGKAKIGTISGTTISYGSEYQFASVSWRLIFVKIDSTHFIVSYRDDSNSYYGTAKIGTVSGSTISYGSAYVFNSSNSDYLGISLLDSTHFVVSYRDAGGDGYGHCKVGTIANTDEITFDNESTFNSASTYNMPVVALDTTHLVVAYQDVGNSNYGTGIIGTYTALQHYDLAMGTGSFILTGKDVSLLAGRKIVCEAGSFILTGINTIFTYGKRIVCETGNFILTGNDATFKIARRIVCETGSFVLTGVDVGLNRGYKIVCDVGRFILTGIDVLLKRGMHNRAKVSTSFTNRSKNSTSLTNKAKNSTSLTNKAKVSTSLTNKAKVSTSFTNRT